MPSSNVWPSFKENKQTISLQHVHMSHFTTIFFAEQLFPSGKQSNSFIVYRWGHFIMTHFTWKMFFHYRFKPDHIMRWRKVLLIWVGNAFVSPSFSELSFEGVYAKRDCNCFEFIWEKRAPMCFSFWVTPKERLLSFGVNKWDVLCHTVCFCFCNQPNPFKHVGELLFST